jgi:hypothetical protein
MLGVLSKLSRQNDGTFFDLQSIFALLENVHAPSGHSCPGTRSTQRRGQKIGGKPDRQV